MASLANIAKVAVLAGPALIVGSLLDFRVMLVCKGFTDNFAYGHSALKSLGFLAWVTLVGLLVLSGTRLPQPRRLRAIALFSVSLGLLMSLGEQIALSQSLGLPPASRGSVLCLNGAASANAITHMHVSKAPLGWLLWDRLDLTDLGEPFAAFFPDWWLFAHLGVQLISAVALALLVADTIQRLQWGDGLCLVLASYSLLKGMVDGGPFWPELQVSSLALVLICLGRRWWPSVLLLGAGFWAYLALSRDNAAFFAFMHLTTVIITLGSGPLLQRVWTRNRPATSILAVGLVLSLAGLSYYEAANLSSRNAISLYWYARQPLPEGQEITVVALKGQVTPNDLLDIGTRHSGRQFELMTATVRRATTVRELGRELKLNLIRKPIFLAPTETPYVKAELHYFEPWPEGWPSSEMVLRHRYRVEGEKVTLELQFRPGTNYNAFFDAMPPGLLQLQRQTQRTTPHPWDASWDTHDTLPVGSLKPNFLTAPKPGGR